MRHALKTVAAVLFTVPAAWACGPYGPEGELKQLLSEHAARERAGESAASLAALESHIDALAGAKDAAFSGLYWHRDLAEAKREAEARKLPILSLRLLGDLTCDRSCANSRFFRTALYANADLAGWLGANVILHWESVRPVPVIVIDMGDGRRIERTITGNSIHWLLLPDGSVVDGFPGLYGPQAFRQALEPAVRVAQNALAGPARERAGVLAGHHWTTRSRLEAEAAKAGIWAEPVAARGRFPRAGEGAQMAMGKSAVERPMLDALGDTPAPEDPKWDRVTAMHLERCRLDARSKKLMARKSARSMRGAEEQAELAAQFERLMAKDTAQNELRLRPVILLWLSRGMGKGLRGQGPQEDQLRALNRRVYAELFLTPEDDPWLGLAPRAEYAALEDAGLIER